MEFKLLIYFSGVIASLILIYLLNRTIDKLNPITLQLAMMISVGSWITVIIVMTYILANIQPFTKMYYKLTKWYEGK